MFGMGMPEILIILAVALIVLGPKKLPEMAKALGRGSAEFRKATQDFKQSLDADDDLKEARDTMREIKGDIEETIQGAMAGKASPKVNNAVSEEDLEHTFNEDVKKAPQGPEKDRANQEAASADQEAASKESSKDA